MNEFCMVSLRLEPDEGITFDSWCIGETPQLAISLWKRSHPKLASILKSTTTITPTSKPIVGDSAPLTKVGIPSGVFHRKTGKNVQGRAVK